MTNLDIADRREKLQPTSAALAWAPYIIAVLALCAAVTVAAVGGPTPLAVALAGAAVIGGGVQITVNIRR
ncbi:hypothetical protein RKD23_007956 [Streptomyces sp. SAI-170]|uniref:hypothetical protein n=1 Tax=Streptomyces sp. SAI-170 TaxID=3377729 RepID=UPI003C7B4809